MKRIKHIKERLLRSTHPAKRFFLAFLIFAFGAATAFTISINTATAGPGTPFGGLITFVLTCNCSGNYAVYFSDLNRRLTGSIGSNVPAMSSSVPTPAGLPLIYQPGQTIVYEFGPPLRPGIWMLGTWQPGGQCRVFMGKLCGVVPTRGTMYMVGTSR
jgi:hypothetical protein